MSHSVRIAPQAIKQLHTIGMWWATHRDKAPTLFEDEVAHALVLLADAPWIGMRVRSRRQGVRRLLLRGSGYHVYYAVDDAAEIVEVLAIWHTSRNAQPRL